MGSLALVRHGQASFGAADYDRLSDRGVEQARALGARWAAEGLTAIYTGPLRRQVDTARIARDVAIAAGHALPEPIELPGLAELPAFELIARFLPEVARAHPELAGLVDGSAAGGDRAALMAPPATAPAARPPGAGPAQHLWDVAFWKVLEGWSQGRFELGAIEPYAVFVDRVEGALATMITHHQAGGARIAAVTSGGPIGLALRRVLGLDDHAMFRLWRVVRNASVTDLLWRSRSAGRAGDLSLLAFNQVDHLPPSSHTFR